MTVKVALIALLCIFCYKTPLLVLGLVTLGAAAVVHPFLKFVKFLFGGK